MRLNHMAARKHMPSMRGWSRTGHCSATSITIVRPWYYPHLFTDHRWLLDIPAAPHNTPSTVLRPLAQSIEFIHGNHQHTQREANSIRIRFFPSNGPGVAVEIHDS